MRCWKSLGYTVINTWSGTFCFLSKDDCQWELLRVKSWWLLFCLNLCSLVSLTDGAGIKYLRAQKFWNVKYSLWYLLPWKITIIHVLNLYCYHFPLLCECCIYRVSWVDTSVNQWYWWYFKQNFHRVSHCTLSGLLYKGQIRWILTHKLCY